MSLPRTRVSGHPRGPGRRHCGDEFDVERREVFRSAKMRLVYISQDRQEFAFAIKEIARCIQAPEEGSWSVLKRAVRIAWEFNSQSPVCVFRRRRKRSFVSRPESEFYATVKAISMALEAAERFGRVV